MSLKDFVDSLNLPISGEYSQDDNVYTVNIKDSDEYSKVYNIISLNDNLEVVDSNITTSDLALFTFTDGYFEIKISANFDKDVYKLVVSNR